MGTWHYEDNPVIMPEPETIPPYNYTTGYARETLVNNS